MKIKCNLQSLDSIIIKASPPRQPIRSLLLAIFPYGMQPCPQISPLAIISSQPASEGGVLNRPLGVRDLIWSNCVYVYIVIVVVVVVVV